MQRPEDEEVVRLKRDPRAPQQWGLPPPPPESADYSQWSGSADFTEPRRWQPAADDRQQVGLSAGPWPLQSECRPCTLPWSRAPAAVPVLMGVSTRGCML